MNVLLLLYGEDDDRSDFAERTGFSQPVQLVTSPGAAVSTPAASAFLRALRTGAVASIEEHPLARLLQWGVPVTLNTDDPGMFDCDIVGEYRLAHDRFGLTPAELVAIAHTGVTAVFCSEELKATLRAEIDAVPLPAW